MKNLTLIFMLLLTFLSCKKDKEVVTTPIDEFGTYNPNYILPRVLTYLPPMENPDFNKMTEEGVRLGKSLYYDKILSTNGLSCSSCHLRSQSYTISAMGPIGTAVLPHVNVGWQKAFGWNGGEDHLDDVALADLAEGNPFLDANNDSILNRLKRNKNYQILFWKAFGVYDEQSKDCRNLCQGTNTSKVFGNRK